MQNAMLVTTLLSLLSVANTTALANTAPTDIIVKLRKPNELRLVPGVESARKLFATTYIVRTTNEKLAKQYINKNFDVVYIENNHRAEKTKLPTPEKISAKTLQRQSAGYFNDPLVGRIWSFADATAGGISIDAAYRVHATTATTPVIVAVVDTGVDYNHEDLKDVMWKNEREIPGNGIDDDNNGYVDDVFGINTLQRTKQGIPTGNPMDTHSHGTHVSGTIAAKQNNGIGIAGIASNVKIMAIRTVPNDGDETDIDVAESFIYAAKNGAKLINCSFGKSSNEGKNLIPDTIKYIGEKYGTLVVAAAGNDSSDIDLKPQYPASHPNNNLLIIASSSSNGALSYFSNFGKLNVDVAAPGANIYSTVPGNRYESMSGTSMATPTTVGVLAEILAHHPELGPVELKNALMANVTKSDRYKGKMVSEGRIDLLRTLDQLK